MMQTQKKMSFLPHENNSFHSEKKIIPDKDIYIVFIGFVLAILSNKFE